MFKNSSCGKNSTDGGIKYKTPRMFILEILENLSFVNSNVSYSKNFLL